MRPPPPALRPDPPPPEPENAFEEFVWLMLAFDWSPAELRKCGLGEIDFRQIVRCLRLKLVASGFVVV